MILARFQSKRMRCFLFLQLLFLAQPPAFHLPCVSQNLAPKNFSQPQHKNALEGELQTELFRYVTGFSMATTVGALLKEKVIPAWWVNGTDLVAKHPRNQGYLKIALRALCGYGWLIEKKIPYGTTTSLSYRGTEELNKLTFVLHALEQELYGRETQSQEKSPFYEQLEDWLRKAPHAQGLFLSSYAAVDTTFEAWVQKVQRLMEVAQKTPYAAGSLEEKAFQKLLDQAIGSLFCPIVVALSFKMANKDKTVFEHFSLKNPTLDLDTLVSNPNLDLAFDFLALLGFAKKKGRIVTLTPKGILLLANRRSGSNGVPTSYLALLNQAKALLFGDPTFPRRDESGKELYTNRLMNAEGSGKSHESYFKKYDEKLIEIFNQPLNQQPRMVCDTGCGDASLLIHIYQVVKEKTLRGKHLETHPLILVGVDLNEASLKESARRLKEAEIPFFQTFSGNISDPDAIKEEMQKRDLNIEEALHVRSFLDHNRIFQKPDKITPRQSHTQGAFAFLGEEITPEELQEDLVCHLLRWTPYIKKHGLLAVELLTIQMPVAAQNYGKTLAVAYDLFHGYSDQYLVELDTWLALTEEAEWLPKGEVFLFPPKKELATVCVIHFVHKDSLVGDFIPSADAVNRSL